MTFHTAKKLILFLHSVLRLDLLAVAHFVGLPWFTHTAVMTVALPFIMMLSFLPSLKVLAPVMAAGTVLLIITLATLGIIVVDEWPNRPTDLPSMQWSMAPLALCMILYSYEGINLILPVHAAMKHPSHFDLVFWFSMALVALCLALVAVVSVITFGDVTNGSLTAFLLEAYQNDQGKDNLTSWIMFANTTVSLSVLLTYPLTMYPAIELLGPVLQRNACLSRIFGTGDKVDQEVDDFEDPLAAFEPLPPLPEHGALIEVEDIDDQQLLHNYGALDTADTQQQPTNQEDGDAASDVGSGVSSVIGRSNNFLNIRFALPGD